MLTVHHLKKTFEIKPLFENVCFSLNPGQRVGLVGPNGCGKTTLIRIIAGLDPATEGTVSRNPGLRLGYLPQGFEPDPLKSIGEVVGRVSGNPDVLEAELAETAKALELIHTGGNGNPSKQAQLEAQYEDILQRIHMAEVGHSIDILAGLGIDQIAPDLPCGMLSGGQKTRLSLALVLMGNPQVLLLDEPTNHLDIEMLEWLEDWLIHSPCGVLVTSHDRTFLDHTVNTILEMNPVTHLVRSYPGNYSAYVDQRQAEIERQWATYHDQEEQIRQMKQDIARVKAQAAYTERQASSVRIGGAEMKNKGFKSYQQGIAKKVAKKAVAREKKLDRFLSDEERVERPRRSREIRISFGESQHLGNLVFQMKDLCVGYIYAEPLLRNLNLCVQSGKRIAITGPNGKGKTTLLRTLAGQLPPLQGTIEMGSTVKIGTLSQDQSELDFSSSALQILQPFFKNQTLARSFLGAFQLIGDEPLKPISLLSYGQRSRLALAHMIAEQCNCLLLDEPVNYLDIPSREKFEQALRQFKGTVLVVVHDRYFISRFADEVWWVDDRTVKVKFPERTESAS